MNVRQIQLLIVRELKDMRFNGQVLLLFFTAFTMIFISYGLNNLTIIFFEEPVKIFGGMTSNLTFIGILLTMYAQGNLMVEEKEQGTGLLFRLMKVKRINIFLAKAIVTYGLSYFLFAIGMAVNGYSLPQMLMASFFIIPFFCMWILIGAILAEYAKNTIDISLYGWPIMVVYLIIEGFVKSPILNKLTMIFPNFHIDQGFSLIQGNEFIAALKFMMVPFIWIGIVYFLIKKKRRHTVSN